ncbi:MAG: PilN domain-containing protein, partial [Phycisphaerae bacterium]
STKDRPAETGPHAIRIRGSAARHEDLMTLYKTMNGLRWFHSVQLEEARRQKVARQDAIGFALACNW